MMGWVMTKSTLVVDILKKIFRNHPELNGLIIQPDRGYHLHMRYQQMLKRRGFIQSMHQKMECLDSTMMKTFPNG